MRFDSLQLNLDFSQSVGLARHRIVLAYDTPSARRRRKLGRRLRLGRLGEHGLGVDHVSFADRADRAIVPELRLVPIRHAKAADVVRSLQTAFIARSRAMTSPDRRSRTAMSVPWMLTWSGLPLDTEENCPT